MDMRRISYTVNSRYNKSDITKWRFPPRALNALIIIRLQRISDITKEFTGPKHFVITRVPCIDISVYVHIKAI